MSLTERLLLVFGFLFALLALSLILCWAVYLNQLLPEIVARQTKTEMIGQAADETRRTPSDSHRLLIDMAETIDFLRGDCRQLVEMAQNTQVALHKLQTQVGDCCQPCKCCPCLPCKCKDGCCCPVAPPLPGPGPCCKDRPAPSTVTGVTVETCKPTAKFCRFTMIQIWDDRVWFKWVDTDEKRHESRMSLEEFKRFDAGEVK